MSATPNTSSLPPSTVALVPASIEPIRKGFIDTGIIVDLKIPYIANKFRGPRGGWDGESSLYSERLPLFGFLADPFFNHDISGEYSPLVFPDPTWAAANTSLTIHPYGLEHPFVRMFGTFAGWKGTLNFLITVNSTALVQGEIAYIRAKYSGNGPFKWNYPQLECEEPDNYSLQTLASERRVMLSVSYDETTEFVNSYHYWESVSGLPAGNHTNKPINSMRNYIFVRPNTDITTLNPSGGSLQFKIFMAPGDDFEFVRPSVPHYPNITRYISVSDIYHPFVSTGTLTISQVPLSNPTRELRIDSTWDRRTIPLGNTSGLTATLTAPSGAPFWFDWKVWEPSSDITRWHYFTTMTFGYVDATLGSWYVSVNIDGGTSTAVYTLNSSDFEYNKLMFQFYYTPPPRGNVAPPYFLPNP